jgi:cytochrome b pre-mRNA-processing protein 3
MLKQLRERRARRDLAHALHTRVIEQARRPHFYAVLGVPDTMLGRYEMVCLHAYLVLTRLKREGEAGACVAQTLHNILFDDFDVALRETGLGDMGIGKRIKKLARNLHGRISAYDSGVSASDKELAAALSRNMYASAEPSDAQVTGMVAYVRAARRDIDDCPAAALFAAALAFPDPEAFAPIDTPVRGTEFTQ